MSSPANAARAIPRPGGPALRPVRGVVVSFDPPVLVDGIWTRPRLVVGGVGNGDLEMDLMSDFQRDADAFLSDIVGQPVRVSFFADGTPVCDGVIVTGEKNNGA